MNSKCMRSYHFCHVSKLIKIYLIYSQGNMLNFLVADKTMNIASQIQLNKVMSVCLCRTQRGRVCLFDVVLMLTIQYLIKC